MPTTFVGLVVFVAFLVPGVVYAAQRRARVPEATRSPLVETATVVAVSLAANAVAVAAFGLVRWAAPGSTPDVGRLLAPQSSYWREHLPYVAVWAAATLAASCAVAVFAAHNGWLRRQLGRLVPPPTIVEESAWVHALVAPEGEYVHASVELDDGSNVAGSVAWHSTDLEETADRELVLGPPLRIVTADGGKADLDAQRVIVSARRIVRIDVALLPEDRYGTRADDRGGPDPES